MSVKTPYRFDLDRIFFVWVYFSVLSLLAQALKFAPPSLALLPLVLVILRLNAYRYTVLLLAGYLLFFQASVRGMVTQGLFITDSLTIVFVLLFVLSYMADSSSPKSIPLSPTLALLYLVAAYTLILTPLALLRNPLQYVVYDLKNILYLMIVPILLVMDGKSREPKKFFLLLGAFVLFCSLHCLEVIGRFAVNPVRTITGNEIFISDAVILSALMLRFKLRPATTLLLWFALILSTTALLLTQTRGLWVSTVAALGVYFVLDYFQPKKFRVFALLRDGALAFFLFLVANLASAVILGKTLTGFVRNRFEEGSMVELLDPYSSMGYRVHEALAVWTQRTVFGHGPGATLNVFFTQLGKSEFMEWWAIHSGYFEFLHKFGFVGLFLICGMFGGYYVLAFKLSRSRSRAVSVFGGIIATVILNHLIVSISSGYLLRHGVIVWIPLFLIAERLYAGRPRSGLTRRPI